MVRMVLIHIVVCHPAYSIGITFFEIDLSFQKGHDNCVMRNYGTVQLFGTAGQAKMFSPGTKGQRGKLKILPRDGPGRDSQNSGRHYEKKFTKNIYCPKIFNKFAKFLTDCQKNSFVYFY